MTKSKNIIKLKEPKIRFLILGVRLVFTKLRQAFIKNPIFYYFDLNFYNQTKTGILGYAIGRVLSQITLDNSD